MTSPETLVGSWWQRWQRFWFAPGDPTTMAFLRIVTGCLALYVHLIYSFDLTAFFGRDGWVDLDTVNHTRREEPVSFPPLGWELDKSPRSAALPEAEADRKAIVGWIRTLPTTRPELHRALRLIDPVGVLNKTDRPLYPATELTNDFPALAAAYAGELSPDPKVRETTLKAVAKEIPRDTRGGTREAIPEVFDKLTPEQMKEFVRDLEAFHATLPASATHLSERRAVVSYLSSIAPTMRNNLLVMLADRCDPAVSADRKEADLDYFQYWGVERRHASRTGYPMFSLWYHITEPGEMRVAHGVVLVILVMFTVGLFTRVTSVLAWLAAVSYINRNSQILFGQDTMMNILLIYLMIANCGATLSVDRLIARYRAARASLKRVGKIDGPTAAFLAATPASPSAHFAQRLLQVHFCFIYMASGLSKLKGGSWWSADAVWQTIVNPEFTMIHFEWYQELVRTVFSSRPLYSLAAALGVAHTLVTEIGLPFLVWTRLRPWIVIFAYILHFNIGVFMGLLVFSLFMMTMLTSYIPGWAIRERLFGGPVMDADKVKRPVNPADDADYKKAAWAVAWDARGRIEVVAGKG